MNEFEKNGLGIVVDDGYKRVPVYNKLGKEIGHFDFNPTDIGIIDRYNNAAGDFPKITAPLENIDINADGSVDENDDAAMKAMEEAKKNLFEVFDYIFGGNMSEAFFGSVNPFSPCNGKFYCENALDVVGRFISKQFDKEIQQMNNRVDKYTHGYRTGKHAGGGKRNKGGKK